MLAVVAVVLVIGNLVGGVVIIVSNVGDGHDGDDYFSSHHK